VTQHVENFDGTADNLKDFVLQQQLFAIGVHSCSFVVLLEPLHGSFTGLRKVS